MQTAQLVHASQTPVVRKKATVEVVHYATRKLDGLLSKVSAANRPALEAHIEYSRGQKQMSENGVYSFARPVAHADAILAGKPFTELRGADCLRIVSTFRTIYSPQSLRIRVLNLRMHLRFLYDVDDLEKAESLPKGEGRAMERALKVRRERPQVVGQVIPEAHLDALLQAIPTRDSLHPAFPMEVQDQAKALVLRASGFRGGEFVSLNLTGGGVTREDADGVPLYRLILAGDAPDLKTGARAIYIQEPRAVAALDAWIAVHPFRHLTPASPRWRDGVPLWVNADSGDERPVRLTTTRLRRFVTQLVAWAGLAAAYAAKLTPHDFRHTCATEKARLGWNEFQLCAYFGWSPGSKTPAIYVHLKPSDQRDLILRNAQSMARAAVSAAPQSADAVSALVALLRQALGGGDATPAPLVVHGGPGSESTS